MKKIHIALLAGGNSSEREIALQSAAQIASALDTEKYDVKVIDLHYRNWTWTAPDGTLQEVDKNDFSICEEGQKRLFDYALIIIHGTPGENGMLQGYLEMMGIPHSSCSTTSSAITFDKISTKRAVRDYGLNLAREIFVRRGERVDPRAVVAELGLPLFVKPNASGSSFGVTRVTCAEEILPAVEMAFSESEEVLIEECISGREMGCGVLITKQEEILLPITEIISKKAFFDYEAKYEAGMSEEITPAEISEEIKQELNRATLLAYKACRCTGIVRVDFIVTPEGKPYLIEINSIPGMSGGSIVPKQARAAGITLGELFDKVIEDTYTK
ncbi:MAG: D-alanine--D-alanine ligase [Alistipes sp.]|nr:D-alanine--D-alanine ligase [Alistipes sp.]